MSKSMMDLNLGPDLEIVAELQHNAEMSMLKLLKAQAEQNEAFEKLVNKLAEIKKDLPESALKVEKESYGNTRNKPEVTQPAQNGRGRPKKPQFHPFEID